MLVEEVEIQPEYQRTLLFFCFCNYLCRELPMEINYIESYVNKQNTNSLRINQKIGLSIIEESKSGNSWHLRGRVEDILNYFYRLDRQGSGASEDAP